MTPIIRTGGLSLPEYPIPPILGLYAAPFYFVLKTVGLSFRNNPGLAYYLITLFSIGTLSALGLIIFRKILKEFYHTSEEWADMVTFVAGTGTLILPYSSVFNNHITSGVLIIIGFYYFLDAKRNNKVSSILYSGLFFSLAGSVDITFYIFLPFLIIYFLRQSLKNGLAFLSACVPVIALYLILNIYTSGSLIPPALNSSLWQYPGSAFSQENLSGLAKHSNVSDVLFYSFHMLLGNRGLISHSPVLIFSMLGLFVVFKKNRYFNYKSEYNLILLASLLYLLVYIFNTINYSGWAFGVRWFSSLMLILCLPIAFLENEIKSSKIMKNIFIGIVCISIFISLIGSINPFTVLPGTELQEKINPTNTIITNLKSIVDNFSIKRCARSVLASFIIYFLFFKFIRNLELMPDRK